MKVLSNKSKNNITFKGKVIPPSGILLLNDDGSIIEDLAKPIVEEAKTYTDDAVKNLEDETKKGALSTIDEVKKYTDYAVKNLEDETKKRDSSAVEEAKKYTDNELSKQQSETKKGALSTIDEVKKYTDYAVKNLEAKIPKFDFDEKEKRLHITTK